MTPDPLTASYPVVIVRSSYKDGREAWYAKHPDLPGCAVDGDSPAEARELLDQARIAYIRHLIAHNRPVPEPS